MLVDVVVIDRSDCIQHTDGIKLFLPPEWHLTSYKDNPLLQEKITLSMALFEVIM